MICKRCMVVMGTGTTYQKRGEDRTSSKRFFECRKCGDRIYNNASSFREYLNIEKKKI